MNLMNDLLLRRCHEAVDFQQLLPESPALRTDPNATATNMELARLFAR
jgi:hypothetical protein